MDDQPTGPPGLDRLAEVSAGLAAAPGRARPPTLYVGRPGAAAEAFVLEPGEHADHALRADVVAALLERCATAAPVVWLTRDGDLATEDPDAAWLAAARSACAEARLPLRFAVVTPAGWTLHA